MTALLAHSPVSRTQLGAPVAAYLSVCACVHVCAAGPAVAACSGGDGVGGAAPQWLSPSLLLHPGAETANAPLMYKYHSADISHTFSLSLTRMLTHTHTRTCERAH